MLRKFKKIETNKTERKYILNTISWSTTNYKFVSLVKGYNPAKLEKRAFGVGIYCAS